MASLPGWSSLESVSKWVTVYEVAMIVILAALVAAEVLHFKYSHRKDILIKVREEQQANNAKRDRDEAESRRKAEVSALQGTLSEAQQKLERLNRQAGWRTFDAQAFKDALQAVQIRNTNVWVLNRDDPECAALADAIAGVLGVKASPAQMTIPSMARFVGVAVTGPDTDLVAQLRAALSKGGVAVSPNSPAPPGVTIGMPIIWVGTRPPPG